MDHLGHRPGGRGATGGDDGGFSLVEVMVSLLLLAVVLTSALSLFVRAMGNTDIQAQRGQAIALANDQLEQVRAMPLANLVKGRTAAAVAALWTWDPALTTASVSASDATAAAGAVPLVPTVQTRTVDKLPYVVRTYIDTCYLPTTGSTTCGTAATSAKPMFRITVSVAWSPKNTRKCDATVVKALTGSQASNRCQEYVVTTLRDKSVDATFNTN